MYNLLKISLILLYVFPFNLWALTPIIAYDVRAVTSAFWNPILPSPLTNSSVANQMKWEVNYLWAQSKISSWKHGGGWMAFMVERVGDRTSPTTTVYFNNQQVSYFDTWCFYASNINRTDCLEEYFGGFTPPGLFSSSAISYGNNLNWTATWYIPQ